MKTTRLFKTGVASVALLGLLSPIASFAQTSDIITTQETVVSETTTPPAGVNVTNLPVATGNHLLFRVINPSGSPVNFTVPCLGIMESVPCASERTFFVDTSTVTMNKVAYAVTGPNGEQVACGAVAIPQFSTCLVSIASLNDIINFSTAYSAPIKPEPMYRERPASYTPSKKHKKYRRGYW